MRWLEQLGVIGGAADLDRVAAAGAGGVLCVPAPAGLNAPWWRPGATLTGTSLSTTGGHLVRPVLEGVAAQVAELAACVGADGDARCAGCGSTAA